MEELDFSGIETFAEPQAEEFDFGGIDDFIPATTAGGQSGNTNITPSGSIFLDAANFILDEDYRGEFYKQAGLTARAGVEGTAGAVGILTDPIAEIMNMGLPDEYKIGMLKPAVSKLLTDAGVPEPETTTEKIVQQASQALTGAGGGIKIASKLGADAITTAGKELTKSFTEKAAQQAGGAIGGGIGQKAVEEAGGGEFAQIGGALIGGLGGAGGVQTVKNKIQSKAQLKELIKKNPSHEDVAFYKLKNGQLVDDENAKKAVTQGLSKGIVSTIKSGSKKDIYDMRRMTAIKAKGMKDPMYLANHRPSAVLVVWLH